VPASSLTLTVATENNTASRPSAGRDRPGVPVLSDTVDPAAAVATVGGASDVSVVVILVLVVFHLAVGWKLVRVGTWVTVPPMSKHRVAVLKVVSGQLSVTAAAAECHISRGAPPPAPLPVTRGGLDGLPQVAQSFLTVRTTLPVF
jgi:hypothetical protein